MVEHDQINVRVPRAARKVVKDIAERLRRDAIFLRRLEKWLDEEADNGQASILSDRVQRLEGKVAELYGLLEGDAGSARRPPRARQTDMFVEEAKAPTAAPANADQDREGEGWTAGEGRGRRLTAAGREELRRRLDAGETDREIADALGVRSFTVANQRKAFRSTPPEDLPTS